jgi:hypothetical protein
MTQTQSTAVRTVHALPELSPGFLLAGGTFVLELGEALVPSDVPFGLRPLVIVVQIAGTLFWLFCVYRIHQVLADVTDSKYPIGPIKAVGFLLIPYFNIYWMVKWPKQIADFVNASACGVHMARFWPGFFFLFGICLAFLDLTLNFLVIYSTFFYITRKLGQVDQLRTHTVRTAPIAVV